MNPFCEHCQSFRLELLPRKNRISIPILVFAMSVLMFSLTFLTLRWIPGLPPMQLMGSWVVFLVVIPMFLCFFVLLMIYSSRNLVAIDFQRDYLVLWNSNLGSRIEFKHVRRIILGYGKNADYNEATLENKPYRLTVQVKPLARFSSDITRDQARQISRWVQGKPVDLQLEFPEEELLAVEVEVRSPEQIPDRC